MNLEEQKSMPHGSTFLFFYVCGFFLSKTHEKKAIKRDFLLVSLFQMYDWLIRFIDFIS